MGYDRGQLDKLLKLVETVYNDKNPEVKKFAAGINALAISGTRNSTRVPAYPTEKLDDIYEYCLARNLRQQAEDFYAGFPLERLKAELMDEYIRMGTALRRNDFPEFCLQIFRQIEAVLNSIATDEDFDKWVHQMFDKDMYKDKTIADFIYGSYRLSRKKNAGDGGEDMSKWLIREQYVSNKFAIIEFFVVMAYSPGCTFRTQRYGEMKTLFSRLAIIRNRVHGNSAENFTEKQKQSYYETQKRQSEFFMRFQYLLVDFMDGIRNNYPLYGPVGTQVRKKEVPPKESLIGKTYLISRKGSESVCGEFCKLSDELKSMSGSMEIQSIIENTGPDLDLFPYIVTG